MPAPWLIAGWVRYQVCEITPDISIWGMDPDNVDSESIKEPLLDTAIGFLRRV